MMDMADAIEEAGAETDGCAMDADADDGTYSDKAGRKRIPSLVARHHRLCCRLLPVAGRGRWVIGGPVRDFDDVDPLSFTKAIIVEGLSSFSCREAYVRAVPILVRKGMYASVGAAHQSVLRVSKETDRSPSLMEPSWRMVDDNDVPVRRVLDRAVSALSRSGGRVTEGSIIFVDFVPLRLHPSYAHRTRQLAGRDERRGAAAYRRALSHRGDDDERRLLQAGNSSALTAVRRATTYISRTAEERERGLRAKKKRPWRDVSAPDIIPSRKRLIDMKRRVFERSSRVGHAMVTLDAEGCAIPWAYVRGTGLSGVRKYQAPDGRVKRLACHSHKQRKGKRVSSHSSSGSSLEVPDLPGLAAMEAGALPDKALSLADLKILKSSSLENEDGSDPEIIVAVEFDVVAAIQASIALRTVRCTVDDVLDGATAWSHGSDGGPVRRSAVTLFMLALSAPWLVAGRTPWLPIMYILAGEHHVHTGLGARLDKLVSDAVSKTYEVRVCDGQRSQEGPSKDSSAESDCFDSEATSERSFCDWTGPRLVRIVGDFSMIAHILGLTGGSDDARCPFWWPCSSKMYLSLSAQAGAPGKPRTVADVGRHWELVCWFLGRWCALRNKDLKLESGSVKVRCRLCRVWQCVDTSSVQRVQCSSPACADKSWDAGADAVPDVLPTPLKKMFQLLRRRAGGVRGYPVFRSVPIVLQVPVLHCTGTIMKKLLFFFLSELGELPKTNAKHGVYSVTGRASLAQLYLREHIKLIALIMACEDIVGVPVDSEFLSMWSLALLLTASWRRALTGPMEDRVKALAVMQLAAGLLAPLWSAFKPLDKESKGAGVESLYLHAALSHAGDSMGKNSPAGTVLTDDHVEGEIRATSHHCKTRVNNVSRAQALTELQALAEGAQTAEPKNLFAAELKMYTERIEVCACCARHLGKAELADMYKAIDRAKLSGGVTAEVQGDVGEEEEPPMIAMKLPQELLYSQDAEDVNIKEMPWESKERKVARALATRLQIIKVCMCGAARGMATGSLTRRLQALHRSGVDPDPDMSDVPRCGMDQDPGDWHPFHEPAQRGTPRDSGSGGREFPTRTPSAAAPAALAGALTLADARLLMHRHSAECPRLTGGACDGQCVDEEGDNDVNDDADDESASDEDATTAQDLHAQKRNVADQQPDDGCQGALEEIPGGGSAAATPVLMEPNVVDVPTLAVDMLRDPTVRQIAPPLDILQGVLEGRHVDSVHGRAEPSACRARIAEEDMLMRVFLMRMRQPSFLLWAKTQGIHLGAMREAVQSVIGRLDNLRSALPGNAAFLL